MRMSEGIDSGAERGRFPAAQALIDALVDRRDNIVGDLCVYPPQKKKREKEQSRCQAGATVFLLMAPIASQFRV